MPLAVSGHVSEDGRGYVRRWSAIVYIATLVGLALPTAAAAAPPPAVSQYVEQLPSVGGAKATSGVASLSGVAMTQPPAQTVTGSGSATETTSDGKQSAGRRAHGTASRRGSGANRHAAVTPAGPTSLHAALATSDDSAGLGRGALVALVLLGVSVVAAAGLVLGHRGRARLG